MPREKFPLLLHYHPLVIYRHQVLKQADIVLAMFLLGNELSEGQKSRNFDYYDPRTTGDSSLSACVQSIIAAEIGHERQALEYFQYALLMDLGGCPSRPGCRAPGRSSPSRCSDGEASGHLGAGHRMGQGTRRPGCRTPTAQVHNLS